MTPSITTVNGKGNGNLRIDKLTDSQILDAWFDGVFANPRFHGGKQIPVRSEALEKYMREEYLASWRKINPPRLSYLASSMNHFWYGYKDDPNAPWLV